MHENDPTKNVRCTSHGVLHQHDLPSRGDGKSYEKVTDKVPFGKKMTDGTAHGDALRLTQP